MKKYLLLFLFFLTSEKNYAQAIYISENGEVTFYSYAIIEDIKATSKQVNGIINTATGEFAFIIPIRSFRFAKSLMQEHFNEKFMESDKYPQATFKGKINEKIDFTKDAKLKLTATGKMNIHGVEKDVTENGEINISGNEIVLTTDFNVAIDEFNIKKPQLLFNNIADTINVKLKASYIPYKKK